MAKFSIEYPLDVSDFIYDSTMPNEAFGEVESFGAETVLEALEEASLLPDSDDITVKAKLSSFTDEDPAVAMAIFKVTFSSSEEDLLQELQEQLEEEGFESL